MYQWNLSKMERLKIHDDSQVEILSWIVALLFDVIYM